MKIPVAGNEAITKKFEEKFTFMYEKNRKDSFKNWIFDDNKKCSSTKLAEAGFYFIGSKDEPDAVQCFLCDKSLDGWEENDDPWTEHLTHSPNCLFAKTKTPELGVTMYQNIDFMEELWRKLICNTFSDIEKKVVNEQKMFKKVLLSAKRQSLL